MKNPIVFHQGRKHEVVLYSDKDIERLRHINSLTRKGVNLAGVKVILGMESKK